MWKKRESKEGKNHILLNVVKTNRRKTLPEISALFNQETTPKLSERTVQRRVHEKDIRGL